MTAPTLPTPAPTFTTEIEHDAESVTWTLHIDGASYSRCVEITTANELYGADADGRRGEVREVFDIDVVIDDAPDGDHPHRDVWCEEVPCDYRLLAHWLSERGC